MEMHSNLIAALQELGFTKDTAQQLLKLGRLDRVANLRMFDRLLEEAQRKRGLPVIPVYPGIRFGCDS